MKKVVQFIIIIGFTAAFAQRKQLESKLTSAEWCAGRIVLNDGLELTGLVQYHDQIGLVNFRLDSFTDSKSFQTTEVSRINFIDPKNKQEKFFFSVPNTGLCELLLELNDFSLVSSMDKFRIFDLYEGAHSSNPISSGPSLTVSEKIIFSQNENIIFIGKNGSIDHYLQISNVYDDGAILDKKKTKANILDNTLFQKYTKDHWLEVKEFAKSEKLKFNKKDDIIKILQYYKKLITN